MRGPLQAIGKRFDANVKVVEVPPGPPVQAPLVAEVYGPDYSGQIALAKEVRKAFAGTADIVDIDDSVTAAAPRDIVHVDRQKAALLGVDQQQVATDLQAALHGQNVTYLHTTNAKYPVPIRLRFDNADRADLQNLLSLRVRGNSGNLVPLSELVDVQRSVRQQWIYHKDLLPVVYVVGDMAGPLDSPLYGMADIYRKLRHLNTPSGPLQQNFISQPHDTTSHYSLKWDGEWQITYDTFRDMGIAYSVGLMLIYLLVVAQFRSYRVPLIIMAPIPLTIIGVMPGHALLGRPVHRDLDDRHDRAGRHHRAQLDPAGGLHQQRAGARSLVAGGGDTQRRGTCPAHHSDRAGGDAGCAVHPRRPHFSAAWRSR